MKDPSAETTTCYNCKNAVTPIGGGIITKMYLSILFPLFEF